MIGIGIQYITQCKFRNVADRWGSL